MRTTEIVNSESDLTSILTEYQEKYRSDPNRLINSIPSEEMWRFFIDFYRQGDSKEVKGQMKSGWLLFNTEHGYLESLVEAFQYLMSKKINQNLPEFPELLCEFILESHSRAYRFRGMAPKGYLSTEGWKGYRLKDTNATLEGFKELTCSTEVNFQQCEIIPGEQPRPGKYLDVEKWTDERKTAAYEVCIKNPTLSGNIGIIVSRNVGTMSDDRNAIHKRVKSVVIQKALTFQRQILSAKNMEDKLMAIGTLTTELVKFHVHNDGNARNLGILVLNFLLKENGFTFAIVDPNRAGGYSRAQWKDEIIKGMKRILHLAEYKNLYALTGCSTADVLKQANDEELQYFLKIVAIERRARAQRNYQLLSWLNWKLPFKKLTPQYFVDDSKAIENKEPIESTKVVVTSSRSFFCNASVALSAAGMVATTATGIGPVMGVISGLTLAKAVDMAKEKCKDDLSARRYKKSDSKSDQYILFLNR